MIVLAVLLVGVFMLVGGVFVLCAAAMLPAAQTTGGPGWRRCAQPGWVDEPDMSST